MSEPRLIYFRALLSANVLSDLRKMDFGALGVHRWFGEVIEAELASRRLLKIRVENIPATDEEKVNLTRNGRPKRVTPEKIQMAIFLRRSEGLSWPAIASRLHVGQTTLRRIVERCGRPGRPKFEQMAVD